MKNITKLLGTLLIAVTLAACGTDSSKPEAVALAFVENIHNNKVEDALKLISMPKDTSEGEKKMVDSKITMAVEAEQKKIEKRGGIDSVSVESVEVSEDGNSAKVKIKTSFKNSDAQPKTEVIKLAKEDGNWHVVLTLF